MTIDEDVAVELQRLRRTGNAKLKDLVNNALRLGLRQMNDRPKQKKSFAREHLTRAVFSWPASTTREWLDGQLNGRARVGLPWPSLLAFLRVVTNRRALVRPLATEDAWGQ